MFAVVVSAAPRVCMSKTPSSDQKSPPRAMVQWCIFLIAFAVISRLVIAAIETKDYHSALISSLHVGIVAIGTAIVLRRGAGSSVGDAAKPTT